MTADEAVATLEHDTAGPLNELADALVLASAHLAHAKRHATGTKVDLKGLEDAFSRSIALARTVRERLMARRQATDYASLTSAVREAVSRAEQSLGGDFRLTASYTRTAAIVAADAVHLRRLVSALLDTATAAASSDGCVDVLVIDDPSSERVRRAIRLEVRTTAELGDRDVQVVRLRPLVHALGGTLQVRSPIRGGTVLSLRLIAAC